MFKFDFSFFDSLSLSKDDIENFLEYFPKEFKENYENYKKEPTAENQWVLLDGKRAAGFETNDKRFPTFLNTFYDIIDYKTYKINELDANTDKLERILAHKVDLEKTNLTMPEVQELHDSIASILNGSGTKIVTTVGDLDLLQLQQTNSVKDEALDTAFKNIFKNAGTDTSIFDSATDVGIKTSLTRDASMVWTYIEQINSFLNLAINNIQKFGNYQMQLTMLPITHYNEMEMIKQYNSNATLGVGKLDFIVSTGTKQVEIDSTLKLEEFLDLSNKLVPLASSHTQSSTSEETSSAETSKTDETEKTENDNDEEEKEKTQDSYTGKINEK